ncbi:hypothetical protein TWF718_003187 [Orbilia javanica]|uniref:Uncharacterized protein n=1 Tax=Orbilia javanica TaxID=47235 RepID=A0AAN8R8D4_9PEZI
MESAPGTKGSKKIVTKHFDPDFEDEQNPKIPRGRGRPRKPVIEYEDDDDEPPHPHHIHQHHYYPSHHNPQVLPPGYSYNSYHDFRRAPKSPSEAQSDISASSASYPSTPPYHTTPGLVSPTTFFPSPLEVTNSMGVSLPPLLTLPTIHDHYGRDDPWPWAPQSFYQSSYHSAGSYNY